MSQEKAAEIIDLNASRAAALGQSRNEKAGEFLANARQAAGLGFDAVSAETKIKIEHLEAIEQTRPDRLPATPYAVGFVKVYARFLDLDAEAVAAQFKEDIGAAVREPVELTSAPASPQAAPVIGEGVRRASIFGILAIMIFAAWVAFKILGADNTGIDVGIAETQPRPEARAVLTPRPAEPVENPLQDARIASKPIAEPSVEEAGPAIASSRGPQTTADALALDKDPVTEIDPLADQMQPAVSPAPEIAAEPEPKIAPPPKNAPVQTKFPATEPVVIVSRLTRSVPPAYPDRCGGDAAAVESVTLLFDVTSLGRIANARVISTTNTCFDKSALRTVKRWRFDPKTIDGARQIDTGKTATLHFRQ